MSSKIIITSVLSLFLLLGAGCNQQALSPQNTALPETPSTTAKFMTFENDRLGLSFNYTSALGDIEVGMYGNYQLTLYTDTNIFLAATNPKGDAPARGGYWGDEGKSITNQGSIADFCKGKNNCSLITNPYDVIIAKYVEIIDILQGNTTATTQYYFYNPGSPYPGVVVSSVRLLGNTDVSTAEKMISELVQSIKFTPVK